MPSAPSQHSIDERTFRGVLAKAIGRGPGWTIQRLLWEFRIPTTRPGRMLRNACASCETMGHTAMAALTGGGRRAVRQDTLHAFYDLDVMPPTFDVASFLFLAELDRRERGLGDIHLVIVPGRNLQPQNEAERSVPDEMRRMRVNTILFPVSQLLPSCAGVTLCADRSQAASLRFAGGAVFPREATLAFPVAPDQSRINDPGLAAADPFPMLRAGEPERAAARRWLAERIGERHAVVISLRESPFMPARNSDLAEWIGFADGLDAQRYAAVFVRDTERSLELPAGGLERFPVFEAASWNVGLRMALYEEAFANLAIMHGAMELCWFNDSCRYAAFVPVGTSPQTSPEFLGSRGFREGQSLPFARPWQKLVWQPEEAATIARVFAELVSDIERAHNRQSEI